MAETLYVLERLDDASDWIDVARRHSAADDVDAQVLWMPVCAKLLARNGAARKAAALARDAVQLAETSDALDRTAKAYRDLGEVLVLGQRKNEARDAFASAFEIYEAKGNVVGAGRVRARLDDVAVA